MKKLIAYIATIVLLMAMHASALATTEYVILTNIPTTNSPAQLDNTVWRQAIAALQSHRNGNGVRVDVVNDFDPHDVWGIRDRLITLQPRYVAVVLRPIDIDINFAREFMMMSTTLDNDPFSDFSYGFITGASGQDALNFVDNIIAAETDNTLPGLPPGQSGIRHMPLTIGGYAGGGTNSSVTTNWNSSIYKYLNQTPESYSIIHIAYNDVAYFRSHASASMAGKKMLSVGSQGDPHMLWLFPNQDLHIWLPDNRDYEPSWIEDPGRVQRAGLTSDDIRTPFINGTRGRLYPAVAYNGACHSGVLKNALIDGDTVATFGETHGITRMYEIQNHDFSYALSILKTGITGYFAPIGANHGNNAEQDRINTFLYHEPLGDVHKRVINDVVMGFLGNAPKVVMYTDGDPKPSYEVLTSGTFNPANFATTMLSGKCNRVYFGDPMFNPFADNIGPALSFITSEELTQLDARTLEFSFSIDKPEGFIGSFWDMFHTTSGSRIYTTVDLPHEYNGQPINYDEGVHVEAINLPENYSRLISALEEFEGRTILHLQIEVPIDNYNAIHADTISLRITRTPEIWHMDLLSNSYGSAAAGDIDNDGKLEIVFGTYLNSNGYATLYALNAEDKSVLWSFQTAREGMINTSVAIADVNGDGNKEVIFSDSKHGVVYCLNGLNGNLLWQYQLDSCTVSPPAVGDINNDGKPEVVVGDFNGHVYALKGKNVLQGGENRLLWKNDQSIIGWASGVSLVDLTSDGALDVVVASWFDHAGDNKVHAFNGINGQELWSFQTTPSYTMYHSPACADIDHDSKPELIFTSLNKLYILNGEYPLPTGENRLLVQATVSSVDLKPEILSAPVSLVDLNNDGNMEIVIGGHNIYCYAYRYQEQDPAQRLVKLWAYNVTPDTVNFPTPPGYHTEPSENNVVFRGGAIADLDGDGILDIVFGDKAGRLSVLKGSSGAVLYAYDAKADYGSDVFAIDHSPLLGNFDGDNGLDIFFVGGSGYSESGSNPNDHLPYYYTPDRNYGRAYLIRCGAEGSGGMGKGWYMNRHDLMRSGNYACVAKPSIDRVEISPWYRAYKTTALTAIPKGFADPDSKDNLNYTYQWFKTNGTYSGSITGQTSSRLTPENFIKNDRIRCEITPWNGVNQGANKTSANVTIQNSLPFVWVRSLWPHTPYSGTVNITWSATDADGDDLTNRPVTVKLQAIDRIDRKVYWEQTIANTTNNGQPVAWNTANYPAFDNYDVMVGVSDGAAFGYNKISKVKTTNDPNPVIQPIGNQIAIAGELLSFPVIAHDVNNTTLTYSIYGKPMGATFDANHIFSWTPTPGSIGTHRYVTFTASNGQSRASETVTITVTALAAPSNLTATRNSTNQIELRWAYNSDAAEGFKIERKRSGVFAEIANLSDQNSRHYIDSEGLIEGGIYNYQIRAYNSQGNSAYSNIASTVAQVPAAPSNLTAVVISRSRIDLNWQDRSSNELGFKLERGPGVAGPWSLLNVTVGENTTSCSDVYAQLGTTYYYRAYAYNSSGNSNYSNTASVTTFPPAAPTNLTAIIVSPSHINLRWTDNSDNEQGFWIMRSTNASAFTQIGAVGPNNTTFSDTVGLRSGATYRYSVRAYNNLGTTVSNTVSPAMVAAPSNLTATAVSSSQIALSWRDNSSSEVGFAFERSLNGVRWVQIRGVFQSNVTTYADTGLSPGTTYYYRVRSREYDSDPPSFFYSNYSNVADATTAH